MSVATAEKQEAVQEPEQAEPEQEAPEAQPEQKPESTPAASAGQARKNTTWSVDTDTLQDALASAKAATARAGGAVGYLHMVRLQFGNSRLSVTGSNLELTVARRIPVKGRSGATLFVDAAMALAIVKAMNGETATIRVTSDEEISLSDGEFEATLRTASEGIPAIREPAGGKFSVPAFDLLASAKRAAHAASTEDARPILTAVHFSEVDGKLTMAGTDSYRLAVSNTGAKVRKGLSMLVPAAAIKALAHTVDADEDNIDVHYDERDIVFRSGERTVQAVLIEGEFPNWAGLVPKSAKATVVANREALKTAIDQVRVLAGESPVRITASASKVGVSTVRQDVGTAERTVDGKAKGSFPETAFSGEFLSQALANLGDDDVSVLSTGEAAKPVVIHDGHREQRFVLVMPVRIS